MKAFRFTLEALGRLREQQEREAREKYARTLVMKQRVLEELREAREAMEGAWADWQSRVTSGEVSDEIFRGRVFCVEKEKHCEACEEKLTAVISKVEEAMKAWTEAKQEQEIVEKLRARKRSQYNLALQIEEQKLLDEMAARCGPAADGSLERRESAWN